jgi:hypothetical protein
MMDQAHISVGAPLQFLHSLVPSVGHLIVVVGAVPSHSTRVTEALTVFE